MKQILLMLTVVLMFGCAAKRIANYEESLNPVIGVMSAQEAIYKWGMPTKTIETDTDVIYSWQYPQESCFYGFCNKWNRELIISFDKEKLIMKSWQYFD